MSSSSSGGLRGLAMFMGFAPFESAIVVIEVVVVYEEKSVANVVAVVQNGLLGSTRTQR